MAGNGNRPFGVTIVFILILIQGLLSVGAGIWRLFNRDDGIGWIPAAIGIGIGVVYLLVARGIANGNRAARLLVAAITVLAIVVAVWAVAVAPAVWLAVAIQILIGLAILGLLYNARARQFFGA